MKIKEIYRPIHYPLLEGISHIDDLDIDEFIDKIENISEFEASEKLDGANIRVGFDENGRFFTSRETKGGERFYSENDYPKDFWTTGFRSFHKAAESIKDKLKKYIPNNSSVELEILFGGQPNTIPYGNDINYAVFLRPTMGNPDIEGLKTIKDQISVTLDNVPSTLDGKKTQTIKESHTWKFDVVAKIDTNLFSGISDKKEIKDRIEELKKIVNQKNIYNKLPNATVLELIALPMNKKPEGIDDGDWKTTKEELKNIKEKYLNKILSLKLDIKETLLNEIVRKVSSKFGPEIKDGGWIEGVVFRSKKDTDDQWKLVDKEKFTKINKEVWEIRNETKNIKSNTLREIANLIGHSQLASTYKNKYLEKIGLDNLLKSFDVKKIKNKLLSIINSDIQKLSSYYDEYNKLKKYTNPDTHKRTLQDFASTFKFYDNLKNISSNKDILNIFLKDLD